MLKQAYKYLSNPFYLHIKPNQIIKRSLAFGMFVTLFLFLFKPFGLSNISNQLFTICLHFGIITLIIMLIIGFLIHFMVKKFGNRDKWNVGKEFILNILHLFFIALANLWYANHTEMIDISFNDFIIFQGYTFAIGIFPISVSILLHEQTERKNFEKKAQVLNFNLQHKHNKTIFNEITINSQNISDEDFTISEINILFFKSADNYVEVFFTEKQLLRKKLLRNTLKNIENQITNPEFFRCHKSYLVNLYHLEKISGNAQGFKIHFPFKIDIPVSRKHNNKLAQIRLQKQSTLQDSSYAP